MSTIDVLVPCYRYGRYLREAVTSVLLQADVTVRILIIDDASPDNTSDVAASLTDEDKRVSFVRHSKNIGHIRTYNEGIEWASSKYFLLLSADDYLLPGALERATRLMDSHDDVGMTFGNAIQLSDNGIHPEATPVRSLLGMREQMILSGADFISRSGPKNLVPTATAVVRTSIQKAVGGYRIELPHAGDMEMWLRIASRSRIGVLKENQAVYRRHESNMSSAYFKNSWLPDLQQRHAAVESFFSSVGSSLQSADRLRTSLIRGLAQDALGWASAAINDHDLEISRQLREFAISICPGIAKTARWHVVSAKVRLGPTRSNAIRTTMSKIRRTLRTAGL